MDNLLSFLISSTMFGFVFVFVLFVCLFVCFLFVCFLFCCCCFCLFVFCFVVVVVFFVLFCFVLLVKILIIFSTVSTHFADLKFGNMFVGFFDDVNDLDTLQVFQFQLVIDHRSASKLSAVLPSMHQDFY